MKKISHSIKQYSIFRALTLVVVGVLIVQLLSVQSTFVVGEERTSDALYQWVEDLTLDADAETASEIKDQIMLSLKLPDPGTYILEYYLEDDRKTSIEIQTDGTDMDLHIKVEERDDNGTYSNPADDVITNITQSLITGVPFLEKDFTVSGTTFETIAGKDITNDYDADTENIDTEYLDTLDYSISSSPTDYKPAIGFSMDNHYVIARWNYAGTNDTLDIMIDGYEEGHIMYTKLIKVDPDDPDPIVVDPADPDDSDYEIKEIFKELSGFEVTPIYLIDVDEGVDQVGDNQEVDSAVHPDFINRKNLGDRPGVKINFEHPRKLDIDTWSYVDEDYETVNAMVRPENNPDLSSVGYEITLDGVGDTSTLDIQLMLQDQAGSSSRVVTSNSIDHTDTVTYSYSYPTYEMYVTGALPRVLETDPLENVKTVLDPNDVDDILGWNNLESSSIYEVTKGFSQFVENNETKYYEYFPKILSFRDYAYTYLEYYVYRANDEESYLKMKPYDTGLSLDQHYEVYYAGSYVAGNPQLNLWSTHYEGSNDNDEFVYISIDIEPTSLDDYFQIKVNPFNRRDEEGEEDPFESQITQYRAVDETNIPPAPPQITSVDNVFVVPPDDNSDDPTKIQFDITWNAINKTALDEILENQGPGDHVYYELMISQTPIWDVPGQEYQVIRVYELYEDTDDDYKLRQIQPTPGVEPDGDPFNEDSPRDRGVYDEGYSIGNQALRVDEIIIYSDGTYTPYYSVPENPELSGGYEALITNEGESTFSINGVNYLRMRVVTEKDGVYTVSDSPSAPLSLTLNTTRRDIPIVEGLEYEAVFPGDISDYSDLNNLISIELSWPKVDLADYSRYMIEPLDKNIDKIEYMIYLTKNREDIDDVSDIEVNLIEENKEIAGANAGRVVIDDANLDELRDGSMIFIPIDHDEYSDDSTITVPVDGLDLNNTYYARIVVKLTIDDEVIDFNPPDPADTPPADERSREGDPSAIIGITIPIIPPEPGDDEILPLAPEELVIDYLDGTKIPTTVEWRIPEEITVEENTYGFEVFSVEEVPLPPLRDGNGVSPNGDITLIGTHTELEDYKTEAFRIFYEGSDVVLKKYDGTSWVTQDSDLITDSEGTIRIVDQDNSPNRVLYYYVRTINVENGEPITASAWIAGTLTTDPIKGPENLTVDYDFQAYDEYEELIIRFDVAIEDYAEINSRYFMEIYVHPEDEVAPVLAADYVVGLDEDTISAQLIGQDSFSPVGRLRIYYKIRGLTAGKSYDIKVRIRDESKPQEIIDGDLLDYPTSPYSETITTRTEFDQDTYEKELKYQQYIDYYLAEAEKISQNPYFQLATSDTRSTAKYRENYADGLVRINKNQTFELVVFKKQTNVYYIPADLIKTANDYNVTYVFEPNGHSVSLHPFSIGEGINTEIAQVIEDMNAYGSEYEDYYVEITLSVGTYDGTINSLEPSSDMIHIRMNVLPSKLEEEDMDIALIAELDTIVEIYRVDLEDRLWNELDKGINEVELTTIVQEYLDLVQEEFYVRGQRLLDDQLDDKGYEIEVLNKDLTIGINTSNTDSSHILYGRTTGGWEAMESAYFNQRYHISSKELGSFMSVKQVGSEVLGDYYSTEQLDVINKYRLTDVFTNYELKTPTSPVYNNQMVRTFARLLGAGTLSDDVDFLKEQGVDVPYFGDYGSLNNEIANYLYVQVYALKHQINLDAVTIFDYNQIEDINQIESDYRETLLRGVSLGVIDLDQGQIMPEQTLTVIDFMNLITNIE